MNLLISSIFIGKRQRQRQRKWAATLGGWGGDGSAAEEVRGDNERWEGTAEDDGCGNVGRDDSDEGSEGGDDEDSKGGDRGGKREDAQCWALPGTRGEEGKR